MFKLNNISGTQIAVSIGAIFANFFYHHKHQIRVALDMDPEPVAPTIENDPPHYTFDETFESKIDRYVEEIEKQVIKKPAKPLSEDIEYKGDFKKKDGKIIPHGKGMYISKKNSLRVIGNFKDGAPEGPAEFVYPDGSLLKAEFQNGETKGLGVKYIDNMKYEGELIEGKPGGSGIYSFRNEGKIYVKRQDNTNYAKGYSADGKLWYRGEYNNGRCDGVGEFFYRNGNVYKGQFKEGKMEGMGALYDRYGDTIYKGMFKDDQPAHRFMMYTEPGITVGIVLYNIVQMLRRY